MRTDGQTQGCADDGLDCSAYGSASFLNNLEPVEGLVRTFYRSVNAQGDAEALVYLQPTAVPSVSRILLAVANSAGVWIPAAYALGPEGGDAFLIVNNCLDLAEAENGILKPAAMLVAALQWVDCPWPDPFLCRITALMGSMVVGAGVNPADPRWGWWPLLPIWSP